MKKLLISLLACLLLLSTSACSKDNGLVKVNIDAIFYEGASEEAIVAEAKELGLQFYTIHADGSVTYEIEKAQYEEILKNYKANLQVIVDEFSKGEEKIESFEEITYTDNLDSFNFYVNDEYTAMDSSIAFPFLIMGAYYQNFTGLKIKDIDVKINFIEQDSEEIIETVSFKEIMNRVER